MAAAIREGRFELGDELLLQALTSLRGSELLGLDCPLGWPTPFVGAGAAHAEGRPWPHRHVSGEVARAMMRLHRGMPCMAVMETEGNTRPAPSPNSTSSGSTPVA
jgi:hypothetical protein